MLNRLFGDYLVKKNKIAQEQLESILSVSTDIKAEISTVAVVKKVLTLSQVQSLLEKVDSQTSRIGELAVEEGMITDDRLEQVISYQSNPFMIFVQNLIGNNCLQLQEVNQIIDAFQEEGQYDDVQLEALMLGDIEQIVNVFVPIKNKNLKQLTVTLMQTFRRLIDKDVYLERAYVANTLQVDRYAAQLVTGDMCFKLYISGAMNHLLAIANYFTGDKYAVVDQDALDTVCEFVNCVNGQFATNMSYEDVDIDMNAPECGMEGPYLNGGKLFVIPIHANGYSVRIIYEVYE